MIVKWAGQPDDWKVRHYGNCEVGTAILVIGKWMGSLW